MNVLRNRVATVGIDFRVGWIRNSGYAFVIGRFMHNRITLNRDDFERLINGQSVWTGDRKTEICLEDIGHRVMAYDIDNARRTKKADCCKRCDLPADNLRGMYALDGMTLCHRCIKPDEKRVAAVAR